MGTNADMRVSAKSPPPMALSAATGLYGDGQGPSCIICRRLFPEGGEVRRCLGCGHVWRTDPGAPPRPLAPISLSEIQAPWIPPVLHLRPGMLVPAQLGVTYGLIILDDVLAFEEQPRALLRQIRRLLMPTGWLAITGVDAADNESLTWNNGSRRYFTPWHMVRLTHGMGFQSQDLRHQDGRFVLTLTLLEEVSPAAMATAFISALGRRRRLAAERCLAVALQAEQSAVWGLGSDWQAMLTEEPVLRDVLIAGRLSLFDQSLAGMQVEGRPVLLPTELPGFPGPILITPSVPRIREEMRACAPTGGFVDRLFDPYDSDIDLMQG